MRILITGADTPLGELAAEALGGEHDLKTAGAASAGRPGYRQADLLRPEEAAALVEGVDAVLHLAPYQPPSDDAAALLGSGQGTFVLLHAALKAGVRRVVLASRLELMDYPAEWVVDETWQPRPEATAASLAPYMAELTLREFVRAEPLEGICLRFGPLGDAPDGTTPADAAAALRRAIEMDLGARKHARWAPPPRAPCGTITRCA
jgi:nucleoside-diphosphate-sugar epimerase